MVGFVRPMVIGKKTHLLVNSLATIETPTLILDSPGKIRQKRGIVVWFLFFVGGGVFVGGFCFCVV